MPKRKRSEEKEPEKKQVLRGFFWEGGGRSGFVGRITEHSSGEHEDMIRAANLASTWRSVARLESRRFAMLNPSL